MFSIHQNPTIYFQNQINKVWFVLAVLVGLCLYLPFRSIQWDPNGIIEANSVQVGGEALINPNHFMYRLIGAGVYQGLKFLGYTGQAATILQFVTIAFAALGVGFLFLALEYLTHHRGVSIAIASLVAISWSYWVFSTDIYYITPAAAVVCAMLALLFKPGASLKALPWIGMLCALSILFWEADVFIFPFMAVALAMKYRALRTTWADKNSLRFMLPTFAVLGLTYWIGGSYVQGDQNLIALCKWLISHSSDTAGRLQIWGRWGTDRVFPMLTSSVSSMIPIWNGLGLRELISGTIRVDKILPQLSLLAWALVLLVTVVQLRVNRLRALTRNQRLLLLLFGFTYLIYLAFILWWDPYDPKWFIIPNLFLGLILAIAWSSNKSKPLYATLGISIFIIMAANFTSSILPRGTIPNPAIQKAECFSKKATKNDLLISYNWDWPIYTSYFFGYQGESLSLISGVGKTQRMAAVENAVLRTEQRGGNSYMEDFRSYPGDFILWLGTMVGISPADFDAFQQHAAFECDQVQFVSLSLPKKNWAAASKLDGSVEPLEADPKTLLGEDYR